ncbi:MAG: GatB/YqeY domain-containing protein [Gammaproteobacteria bacterium]
MVAGTRAYVSAPDQRISEDMKTALRARDKRRLGAIRLMLAAIRQREVDTRATLDDPQVLAILDKMVKQRRESIVQYDAAARDDLAAVERFELDVIQGYLPSPLSDADIERLIEAAVAETGANNLRDMGKVMAQLKPQVLGRPDLATISAKVKTRLSSR